MVLSGPLDPRKATVISNEYDEHLFLLWDCWNWPFEGIIIPSGFKSGYSGEGGRGFSLALCMIYEHNIPMEQLEVHKKVFENIDKGNFPEQWQQAVIRKALKCDMPVPGWIFVNHWELTKAHRLWRVQTWRNLTIEWTYSADDVDDFNWIVGDKLHEACSRVRKNASSAECQQSGLILRDAWIEFSQAIRGKLREIERTIGKNDVKAIIDVLDVEDSLKIKARKAFDSTNVLQHDRKASKEQAKECFAISVDAMAEIIKVRFPKQIDPKKDKLIRPN